MSLIVDMRYLHTQNCECIEYKMNFMDMDIMDEKVSIIVEL